MGRVWGCVVGEGGEDIRMFSIIWCIFFLLLPLLAYAGATSFLGHLHFEGYPHFLGYLDFRGHPHIRSLSSNICVWCSCVYLNINISFITTAGTTFAHTGGQVRSLSYSHTYLSGFLPSSDKAQIKLM